MRRLYFLVPDYDSAHTIVDELLLARIEERHIHVIAKEGVPLKDLPEATLAQKSDVVPALERGLALGGVSGLLAGLAAMAFTGGLVVAGGALGVLLATGLGGAGVGAWLSSMIGVDVPNTRLKKFEKAIEAGELLMLIDVPKKRVHEIEDLVKSHHPEADIEGTEPTIPAFP